MKSESTQNALNNVFKYFLKTRKMVGTIEKLNVKESLKTNVEAIKN